MPDPIEFTQLMASASARGDEMKLAESLRTEFISAEPDDVATTADEAGDRVTITSSGKPMTVSQVQAELQILILGE